MRQLALLGAAATAALVAAADPATAQTRTFVSGFGTDSNPCTLAAPCRSLQHAHDTVAAGGEVVALDAAGYGPLTIVKAITVTAIGIEASITSNSTTPTAITINAGLTDTVTIRGLTLISGFTSGTGIDIKSAMSVTIRDCSVSGFPFDGIVIEPTANLDVELHGIFVSGSGDAGLLIFPSGTGALTAAVTDSQFNGNGAGGVAVDGELFSGTIKATLSVVAAANSGNGISIGTVSGHAQPVVMVTGSKLINNALVGLVGQSSVQVFVDRTQISGNSGNGWEAIGGAVVKSYTNNSVNGNANDTLNGVTQISAE